jgi:serine/threonine-protein kinase 24/25/MST4
MLSDPFYYIADTGHQRPTASELLQHRFIRSARKTSYLTELIERYQEWRLKQLPKNQPAPATIRNSIAWENNTMRSDWNFDTVRTVSAMGTIRSMAQDLQMPNGMVPDIEEESEFEESRPSIDTEAATKGSDLAFGIGMNPQAAHSTVVIKPLEKAAQFGGDKIPEEVDTPSGALRKLSVCMLS